MYPAYMIGRCFNFAQGNFSIWISINIPRYMFILKFRALNASRFSSVYTFKLSAPLLAVAR